MKTKLSIPIFAVIAAVVLALGISAFKVQNSEDSHRFSTKYLRYDSGTENVLSSYTEFSSIPPGNCAGGPHICYIVVNDPDNNGVSPSEFSLAFNVIDTNSDHFISDESQGPALVKKQ